MLEPEKWFDKAQAAANFSTGIGDFEYIQSSKIDKTGDKIFQAYNKMHQ